MRRRSRRALVLHCLCTGLRSESGKRLVVASVPRTKIRKLGIAVLLLLAAPRGAKATELPPIPRPETGTEASDHGLSMDGNGGEESGFPARISPEKQLLTRQEALIEGLANARLSNSALDTLIARLSSRGRLQATDFSKMLDEVPDALIEPWQKLALQRLFSAELALVQSPTQAPELAAALKRIRDGYAERTRRFAPWSPILNSQSPQTQALQSQLERAQAEIFRLSREREALERERGRSRPGDQLMDSLLDQLRRRENEKRGSEEANNRPPRPGSGGAPPPFSPPEHGPSKGTEAPKSEPAPPLFPPRDHPGRDREDDLRGMPSGRFFAPAYNEGRSLGPSNDQGANDKKSGGFDFPEKKSKSTKGDGGNPGSSSAAKAKNADSALESVLSKNGASGEADPSGAPIGAPSPGFPGFGGQPMSKSPLSPIGTPDGMAGDPSGGFGGGGFSDMAGGPPSLGGTVSGATGFDGDPFSGIGYGGGGEFGPGGGGFSSFARPVEYGSGFAGSGSDDDVSNGDGGNSNLEPTRRVTPAEQIVMLPAANAGARAWILSRVGTFRTVICGDPRFDAVTVCKTAKARAMAHKIRKEIGFQQNARTR